MLKKTLITLGMASITMQTMAANTMVEVRTSLGNIEIEVFNDKAPISAKNFENYIKAKFYNGTIFHRVIPGFMIQGGGMDSNMIEKKTNPPIQNEASNGLKNLRGTLAMARTNNPNSATSQFFINTVDNTALNKSPMNAGYAVFAKVTKGMEIVDKMTRVPTANYGMHQNVPKQTVKIISMTIKPSNNKTQ